MSYSPEQIAQACQVPLAAARANWPQLLSALVQEGINDHPTRVAVIATVATEVPDFGPIHEYGDAAYFTRMYQGRADLGNLQPGDGIKFAGAGYVQLTGRTNFTEYGKRLGIDLVDNPALALDPHVAALVLALYFKDHNIPALAAAGNWQGVREAVNGGLNGWQRFIQVVNALEAVAEPPDAPLVTRVTMAGTLKVSPDHESKAAVDGQHKPAHLAVGTVIHFCPDPHDPQHRTVFNEWAHLQVDKSDVHGWYLRSSLATS